MRLTEEGGYWAEVPAIFGSNDVWNTNGTK